MFLLTQVLFIPHKTHTTVRQNSTTAKIKPIYNKWGEIQSTSVQMKVSSKFSFFSLDSRKWLIKCSCHSLRMSFSWECLVDRDVHYKNEIFLIKDCFLTLNYFSFYNSLRFLYQSCAFKGFDISLLSGCFQSLT